MERTADDGALKTSFRKLAMKWHPDRNPGDSDSEHRFKEINEAYDILKDPQRRAAYDRFGHAAFEQGGGGAHGFGADFGSAFSDIFEGIFGMGGARQRGTGRERGSDLRFNMQITLEEAYKGKTAQVRLPTSVTCEVCSGTGAKAGTKPKACATCSGQGKIRHSQGFFTLERTCNACHGRGQVIENPCPSCAAPAAPRASARCRSTFRPVSRTARASASPAKAKPDVRGGPAGDLYIFLSLATHAFFQRDGADLHCRVPISMVTAALGGEFEVPTIDGSKTRVKVPGGTQSGRRFRLQSKGMPVLRSKQVGDMYVQVMVETPQNLTKRQRELLAEFEKLSSQRDSAGIRRILRQSEGLLRNRGRGRPEFPRLTHRPVRPLPIV